MSDNTIFFCFEANHTVGYGHLTRMRSLIGELDSYNFHIYVLTSSISFEYLERFLPKNINILIFDGDLFSEKGLTFSIKKVLLHNPNCFILDSYEASENWEKNIQKICPLICIDDHLKKHYADIVINQRAGLEKRKNFFLSNKNWLVGSEFSLISPPANIRSGNLNSRNVLFHAGGTGNYKEYGNTLVNLLNLSKENNFEIYILSSSNQSDLLISNILSNKKLNSEVNILRKVYNLKDIMYKFDIVVGPAGSSTFEAIMAGCIPLSWELKNDGRDGLSSWLHLGHITHLSYDESKDKRTITNILKFIFENRQYLLSNFKQSVGKIDGNGPKRVISEILKYLKTKKISLNKNLKNSQHEGFSKCSLEDARYFMDARNLPVNMNFSTKKDHKITWDEHISWWKDKNFKKFKFCIKGRFEIFGWYKIIKINENKFCKSGWFISNQQGSKNLLKASVSFMSSLEEEIKRKEKKVIWVITVNKNNKYALMMNKKLGFLISNDDSLEQNIGNIYSHTNLEEFIIMTKAI